MNGLLASYLMGLLRYALVGVFAWLVNNGISTPEQNEQLLTGIVGGIAMALWLLWVKYKDQILRRIGLNLPARSTESDLKEAVKEQAPVTAAVSKVLGFAGVLLTVGAFSACASVSLKERVTNGVSAVNISVNTLQSAEEAVRTSGVVPQWTPDRYKAFNGHLVRYYDAMNPVLDLLVTWRAGDPPPATLKQQLGVAKEALEAALKTLPPDSGGSLASILTNAQTAVRGLLDLFNVLQEGRGL